MGIVTPAPPPEVEAAFVRGLPAFLPGRAGGERGEQRFAGKPHVLPALEDVMRSDSKLPYEAAQQVFILECAEVAKFADAAAAVPAGWRFFAGREPPSTILGRVSFRPPGRWKLTAVSCGEPVRRVLQASRSLGGLDRVRGGEFELRVLMMPALCVDGYWLASLDRARGDLLMPFPGRPGHPLARRWNEPVYPLADFLASMRPHARLQSRQGSQRVVVLDPEPATIT